VQQLSLLAPQLATPGALVWQLAPVVVEPVHVPPLHVPVAHGQGSPHCPFDPHVCIEELSEHRLSPVAQPPASPLLGPALLPLEPGLQPKALELEPLLLEPPDPEPLPPLLPDPELLRDPELPPDPEPLLTVAPLPEPELLARDPVLERSKPASTTDAVRPPHADATPTNANMAGQCLRMGPHLSTGTSAMIGPPEGVRGGSISHLAPILAFSAPIFPWRALNRSRTRTRTLRQSVPFCVVS